MKRASATAESERSVTEDGRCGWWRLLSGWCTVDATGESSETAGSGSAARRTRHTTPRHGQARLSPIARPWRRSSEAHSIDHPRCESGRVLQRYGRHRAHRERRRERWRRLAGYTYLPNGRFIVRNSWNTSWGDKGFGYVSPAYIAAGFFNESYGVTV